MPLFVFVASSGSTHSVNGETLRSNRNRLKEWAILIGPAALLVTLDQVSKWLVRQNLAVGEMWAPIPALSKIFTFTHVQNTGVSFGQLPGLGWLFMLVNLAVVVGILIYYPRIPAGQWKLRLALALLLVGALGNWIDRLRTAFLIAGQTGSFWTARTRWPTTGSDGIRVFLTGTTMLIGRPPEPRLCRSELRSG